MALSESGSSCWLHGVSHRVQRNGSDVHAPPVDSQVKGRSLLCQLEGRELSWKVRGLCVDTQWACTYWPTSGTLV